ncbi:hypothetical protein [Actinobaculum massiliense]|uniref:Uncharacterized protein n=1 Tax=Actinobaculum massiliense ACS-171-V-Col2 TaxID=883066 RepID=K9F2A0_9ACTO|nr:hypothetical protein [Actinobaculum massiliense]EKU95615.1 hypothetical protein HMPREF9233_00402 [Actinobaculum massiliense ACS-171-V-Col2]MDK8319008.1 hypothetical protein [Actinobaculum massiliense]MDK8567643.1 hypothetical protein [Actinobaculum massiliense]
MRAIAQQLRNAPISEATNGQLERLISDLMPCRQAMQGIEAAWLAEAAKRRRACKLAKAGKRHPEGEGDPPPSPRFDDPFMFPDPKTLLETNGESHATAHHTLERAQAVTDFPLFGQALKDGELTAGHIDVLRKRIGESRPLRIYLEKHPEEEAELLLLAPQAPTSCPAGANAGDLWEESARLGD